MAHLHRAESGDTEVYQCDCSPLFACLNRPPTEANGHNQVSNHRGFGFVVFQDPNTVHGSILLRFAYDRQYDGVVGFTLHLSAL